MHFTPIVVIPNLVILGFVMYLLLGVDKQAVEMA